MGPVIIGAGISGLAAALRLVRAGERPTILEPRDPGGMIRSRIEGGFTLELGPNVLVERPDIVALLNELRLQDEVVYPSVEPYGQYVWFQGGACKVPAGVRELLGSPLFSLRTKAALPCRLVRKGVLRAAHEDASVLDFFAPLIGADSAKALLDPVLKGIYGGDVSSLSARTLFPGLWGAACEKKSVLGYMRSKPKGGKPRIFVIRGGIEKLVGALIRELDGNVNWVRDAATALRRTADGFEIATRSSGVIHTNSCIVTTAGRTTSSFIGDIEPELAKKLSEVAFASLTVLHFAVARDEKLIDRAFGVLCPGGMPENFLGVMFNSLIFPHMAPPDRHLLTVIVGGAQAGEATPDLERLRAVVPGMLAEMFGIHGASWLGDFSWQGAIPQLAVGHFRLVEALDAAEDRNPGLVFVGVDRGGVGVSDRLRVAREGLDRVRPAAADGAANRVVA